MIPCWETCAPLPDEFGGDVEFLIRTEVERGNREYLVQHDAAVNQRYSLSLTTNWHNEPETAYGLHDSHTTQTHDDRIGSRGA